MPPNHRFALIIIIAILGLLFLCWLSSVIPIQG